MEQEVIPLHRFEDQLAHQSQFAVRQIRVSAQQIGQWTTLPAHRHDFYEICLFVKASGVHHINWNPHPIHDKTVFVLSPDTVHLVELQGEVHAYILCFGKDFVVSGLGERCAAWLAGFEKHSPFPVADFSALQLTVKQLLHETHSPAAGRDEMVKAYVQILLVQLLRGQEPTPEEDLPPDGRPPKFHAKLDEFKELLDAHYKQHYSVQQYATLLAVSVKQLNRVCKAATGKTAGAFVQERLNAEAKRLLYNTALSIKEIAFALGFREPSHFSHFFSKQNGMFPHFFREIMLSRKE